MSRLHLPRRAIEIDIKKDLKSKMVFLGGPRQVGKTTLAQGLLNGFRDGHPGYFNWDEVDHRKAIHDKSWPSSQKLIVLDEIHKNKTWRNLIKGIYDTQKNSHQFLITGSARLDHFRKGGDSLLGRYYYHRLHPYSLRELGISRKNTLTLLKFGGFPEPLLAQDEDNLRRWHLSRLSKLVRIDLRDLETVKNLDQVELLGNALLNRVGSPLSYLNLSQNIEIDQKTCKRWIGILDALYFSYRVAPYGAPKIKAVKKEQKLYLWDWSQIESEGARFENMVGSHLLKTCHHLEDTKGYHMELRYLRDTQAREVDFVVIKDKKPLYAVECKLNDSTPSSNLYYFKERTGIPKFYQVHLGTEERTPKDGIHIIPFEKFIERENIS